MGVCRGGVTPGAPQAWKPAMPHRRKKGKGGGFCPGLKFQPDESWLYLAVHKWDEEWVEVPLNTLTLLFTLRFASIGTTKVRFLLEPTQSDREVSVRLRKDELPLQSEKELDELVPSQVKCCKAPVWFLPGQRTCVAGLCSVARYMLRMAAEAEGLQACQRLLGFQQGCLAAPAEVSTWTSFCELEVASAMQNGNKIINIPEAIAKFEAHLGQPVRMHNIRDVMQKSGTIKTRVVEGGREVAEDGEDPVLLFAKESHVFAEGPELLLSDLLLYPVFHLLNIQTDIFCSASTVPNSAQWLQLVETTGAGEVMNSLLWQELATEKTSWLDLPLPVVPQHSLYKSDPARDGGKGYTRQTDVSRAVKWWDESGLESLQQGEVASGQPLDWASLPPLVLPGAGSLPEARLARKAAQLESLALALVEIAKEGDTVVDFCAGGGHLGLLLSHLLPHSVVHMVENKEESLARARARGLAMPGQNTWFFQSNLDYYQGAFQVGCSLHACGLATDLVMRKCTDQRAAFVCCPCCYGGVSATEGLTYPRSSQFATLSYEDFLILGHAADQTEVGSLKQEQGRLCMDLVDTDRALAVEQLGYKVSLTKLTPQDCTPKNNLLVGRPKVD